MTQRTVISRDGKPVATVTGDPMPWFHRHIGGYSMDHAIRHEGYSITTYDDGYGQQEPVSPFSRVVRLGTFGYTGTSRFSTYCKIDWNGTRLSITGVEGPLPSGNCRGSAGQISETIGEHIAGRYDDVTYAPGWSFDLVGKFLDVWDTWHLNDMRSNCAHQHERGITYDAAPKYVCPTCDYKIGSSWLTEPVPLDVLAFLVQLPETDRQPAWV